MSFVIDFFPRCDHHVFLSHSGVDKNHLVMPVYEHLRAHKIVPWVDRHDFAYGRDSLSALAEGVVRSRHVVFFLTPAMLTNPKGWCPIELGYADLVQRNLRGAGVDWVNVILPLVFLPNPKDVLPGTVWRTLWDRAPTHAAEHALNPVAWAVSEIRRFLSVEQRRAEQFEKRCKKERVFRETLNRTFGLKERVTIFDPQPIPTSDPTDNM